MKERKRTRRRNAIKLLLKQYHQLKYMPELTEYQRGYKAACDIVASVYSEGDFR